MDVSDIVREYYNQNVEMEWGRIEGRPEFLLTCRFLDRYIKPGDKVLDIGGGPGRYSFYLAEKGCDVTLLDISPENVAFAKARAAAESVSLKAVVGDGRWVENSVTEVYDHVLLMGPMYHLQEEAERVQAVESALKRLKKGGLLFASFISSFAGIIYFMKQAPTQIMLDSEVEFIQHCREQKSFAGLGFTETFMVEKTEVVPFFEHFSLEKLHLFSQEGILTPCEERIMSQSPEVVKVWLDLAEQFCEREDMLSWGEHLMYIGRYI